MSTRFLPLFIALSLLAAGRGAAALCVPAGGAGRRAAATFHEAAQTGDWRAAMALLEGEAEPANSSSFAYAISACGRAGRCQEALELVRQMRDSGHLPQTWTYNSAIAACSKGGDWEAALNTLNEMSGDTGAAPDVCSFNTVMTATCRAGEAERSLQLFTRLTDKGLQPDEITYNLALSACRKAGQGERAAALVAQMEADGLAPGEEALTNALSACATSVADRWHAAALWDKLLAACSAEAGGAGRPSLRAFKAALAVAARTVDAERAASLLSLMRASALEPDDVACSLATRASVQQWPQAISMLEITYAAPAAAPRSDPDAPADAAAAASGGVTPAVSLAARATIAACGRAGQWEKGLEVLAGWQAKAEAEAEGPQGPMAASVYGAALEGCRAGGAWREAKACLQAMRERGVAADIGCFNAVLTACHAAEQWEEVYALLYEMREAGLTTPETLRPFHKGMWKQAKVKLGLAPPLSAAGKARKVRSRRYRQAASVAGRKMR